MQILFYLLSFLDFIDPSCNLTWLQCTGISTAEFWVNPVIYWTGLPSARSALISLMDWRCSWALKSPGTEQPTSMVANFCQPTAGWLVRTLPIGKGPLEPPALKPHLESLGRCHGPSSELISLDKPNTVPRNILCTVSFTNEKLWSFIIAGGRMTACKSFKAFRCPEESRWLLGRHGCKNICHGRLLSKDRLWKIFFWYGFLSWMQVSKCYPGCPWLHWSSKTVLWW